MEWLRTSDRWLDGGLGEPSCTSAARSSSLETVKWCRAHNIPWGSGTSSGAMASGNLEPLQWCRDNGCPWGTGTFKMTILQGSIEALAWCHANCCPLDSSLIKEGLANGYHEYDELMEWCRHRLPPEPARRGAMRMGMGAGMSLAPPRTIRGTRQSKRSRGIRTPSPP